MIHPKTEIRSVSQLIGIGVFATDFIPRGTIVVIRDEFDFSFKNEEFELLPDAMQEAMYRHMYRDKSGDLILSWDHARYLNHNCHSNTLMTDYNLEIAVRDIEAGEELTTDYGLLNVIEPYELFCGCDGCRGHLRLDDIDRFADRWDADILDNLKRLETVPQPLLPAMQRSARLRLQGLLEGTQAYSSVRSLKWRPAALTP